MKCRPSENRTLTNIKDKWITVTDIRLDKRQKWNVIYISDTFVQVEYKIIVLSMTREAFDNTFELII